MAAEYMSLSRTLVVKERLDKMETEGLMLLVLNSLVILQKERKVGEEHKAAFLKALRSRLEVMEAANATS